MIAGPIFALDLATATGIAVGRPGEVPRVYAIRLKKPGEGIGAAGANLIAHLSEAWSAKRPGLIFKEAPLMLSGFATYGNSNDTVRLTFALHGIVEAMAARFGIACTERPVATIRKHYLGTAKTGDRPATKRAVIQRGKLLGYLPKDCTDDNAGDAAAAWDFACAHLARRPPSVLHLFGETAA